MTTRPILVSLGFSPTIQRTIVTPAYQKDAVVRAEQVLVEAGGKAVFVARVLHQLGFDSVHLSYSGRRSPEFTSFLDQEAFRSVTVPSPDRIRQCTTIVELDDEKSAPAKPYVRSVTEFVEPSAPVPPETGTKIKKLLETHLDQAAAMIIAGSVAPGFDQGLITECVELALAREKMVVLDIRGEELLAALALGPQVVKINLSEFAQTFLPAKAAWIAQCEAEQVQLHQSLVAETLEDLTDDSRTTIIITRGPQSVWWAANGQFQEQALPNLPRSAIVNPVGSGDAFTAGLSASVLGKGVEGFKGLSSDQVTIAIEKGIACAQANARLLQPGRISI